MNHATIDKDGFRVPLIGVSPSAVLEECDCCHDVNGVSDTEFNGVQFLCRKCRSRDCGNFLFPVSGGLVS